MAASSDPSPASAAAGERADRRGIQSIEVGGSLLQALVDHGQPMILKDLAAAAEMPAAKAHPYLVSFGKLGLIEQDPLTGRYGLGRFALQMGLTALHALDPIKVAMPEIALLADDIQFNVAIAVWGNLGPTVIHIEECSKPIHVNMRAGTVMTPLMFSATGRVFAAFQPARIVTPILADEIAHFSAPEHGALRLSQQGVDEVIAETRTHGMARALGNPIPGIYAFSAPVFDRAGHLSLAITAMGPVDTFDADWKGDTAARLRACARTIEERLGRSAA